MFTATARLRVAGQALLFWPHDEAGIGQRWWQILPIWHQKLLALERDHRLGLRHRLCLPRLQAADEGEQSSLKLSTQDGPSPQAAQECLIHRRIEAVEAEMSARVQSFDVLHHMRSDACGGVHRDIERHHIGGSNLLLVQATARQILTYHSRAGLP